MSLFMKVATLFLSLIVLIPSVSSQVKDTNHITLASTTSTRDTGLFSSILPIFTKKTGIKIKVIAVGTGQAIKIAKNGDADVLLVHHKESEDTFVADGYGIKRHVIMYNDFVVVGPTKDPAKILGMKDVVKAFQKIAQNKSVFLSRGDDSGTNKKEYSLWLAGKINTIKASGGWYRQTGSGMGATLNMASAMNAYTLADRGTWLAFKNKGNLRVLLEGDNRLINPYGVILVNPKRHPHVKAATGKRLIDWLISKEGQSAISAFKINGEQLFSSAVN